MDIIKLRFNPMAAVEGKTILLIYKYIQLVFYDWMVKNSTLRGLRLRWVKYGYHKRTTYNIATISRYTELFLGFTILSSSELQHIWVTPMDCLTLASLYSLGKKPDLWFLSTVFLGSRGGIFILPTETPPPCAVTFLGSLPFPTIWRPALNLPSCAT